MINKILNVNSIDEIEHRYGRLHQRVQRRLTDHYNHWLGLQLVAYGDDWQRKDALGRINSRIKAGRSAFPKTPTIDDFVKRERDRFSDIDRIHLKELRELRDYANQQAERGILRDEAQLLYGYLVVMLYGSYGKKCIPAK